MPQDSATGAGARRRSFLTLGDLAQSELRRWRAAAHVAFDDSEMGDLFVAEFLRKLASIAANRRGPYSLEDINEFFLRALRDTKRVEPASRLDGVNDGTAPDFSMQLEEAIRRFLEK